MNAPAAWPLGIKPCTPAPTLHVKRFDGPFCPRASWSCAGTGCPQCTIDSGDPEQPYDHVGALCACCGDQRLTEGAWQVGERAGCCFDCAAYYVADELGLDADSAQGIATAQRILEAA